MLKKTHPQLDLMFDFPKNISLGFNELGWLGGQHDGYLDVMLTYQIFCWMAPRSQFLFSHFSVFVPHFGMTKIVEERPLAKSATLESTTYQGFLEDCSIIF